MSTSDYHPGPRRIAAIDADGVRGWIEDTASPAAAAGRPAQVSVRTESGLVVSVPRALLVGPTKGTYALRASFAQLASQQATVPGARGADAGSPGGPAAQAGTTATPLVIPVLAEKLVVGTRPVVTGRVRLTKRVRSREEAIDQTVEGERAEVERVPINRMIETAPEIRYEGATMVIPIVEEVIVVEKRLMLREELRITKRHFAQQIQETVTVRAEEVTVERLDRLGRKKSGVNE